MRKTTKTNVVNRTAVVRCFVGVVAIVRGQRNEGILRLRLYVRDRLTQLAGDLARGLCRLQPSWRNAMAPARIPAGSHHESARSMHCSEPSRPSTGQIPSRFRYRNR